MLIFIAGVKPFSSKSCNCWNMWLQNSRSQLLEKSIHQYPCTVKSRAANRKWFRSLLPTISWQWEFFKPTPTVFNRVILNLISLNMPFESIHPKSLFHPHSHSTYNLQYLIHRWLLTSQRSLLTWNILHSPKWSFNVFSVEAIVVWLKPVEDVGLARGLWMPTFSFEAMLLFWKQESAKRGQVTTVSHMKNETSWWGIRKFVPVGTFSWWNKTCWSVSFLLSFAQFMQNLFKVHTCDGSCYIEKVLHDYSFRIPVTSQH